MRFRLKQKTGKRFHSNLLVTNRASEWDLFPICECKFKLFLGVKSKCSVTFISKEKNLNFVNYVQ